MYKPLVLLLLAVAALLSLVAAEFPTFCKCTCFKNSTIVRLGPQDPSATPPAAIKAAPPSSSPPPAPPPSTNILRRLNPFDYYQVWRQSPPQHHEQQQNQHQSSKRAASSSCTQCNRAFCLNYNLPICKDAGEKDVVAMCFRRDSRKDQIIVWGFILGTAGLLGWAAMRRVAEGGSGGGRVRGGARARGQTATAEPLAEPPVGGAFGGLSRARAVEVDRGAYVPVGEGVR